MPHISCGEPSTGGMLPELRALQERGIIRVDDLVLVQKDQDSRVTTREVSDRSGEEARPFGPIAGAILNLLSVDNIEHVAQGMENNSTAAIAMFEHLWAVHLKETIASARGRELRAGLVAPPEADTWVADTATPSAEIYG